MKLLVTGSVSDGRLILSNRKRFDDDIKQFEGKRVEVVISKLNKRKSNEQNRYLWGVVYPCALRGFQDAGHSGLDLNDIHEYFKGQYLSKGKEIANPKTGETITVSKTTTILSTTEMMEYIEEIARFCAEFLNTIIPDPTPLWH